MSSGLPNSSRRSNHARSSRRHEPRPPSPRRSRRELGAWQRCPSPRDVRFLPIQWREHLALAVSFIGIGIYWLQHHYVGRLYAKTDHLLSLINLGFLLGIMWLPYPTRLWAAHLGTQGERFSSVLLAVGLLMPAVFWMGKWLYALPGRRLLDPRLAEEYLRQMTFRYGVTMVLLLVAPLFAVFVPRLGVGLAIAVTLYWVVPQPTPRYRPGEDPGKAEQEAA